MKLTNTFFLSAVVLGLQASAQPVILNGNNFPASGRVDTIFVSGASSVLPGSAGANVTWNLSTVSPISKGASLEIVNASSTPYAASYPAANKVTMVNYNGNVSYHYRSISATKYETIAESVSATTSFNYTPNGKTVYPLPFHYNDVVIDTYQMVSASAGALTITYDGYGTVITPHGTYNNVVRYKSDNGTNFSYTWLRTSPLYYVASYSNSSQSYVFIKPTTATGISEQQNENNSATVYPNPVADNATIRITSNIREGHFMLIDITGKTVKELDIRNGAAILNRDGVSAGMYTYIITGSNTIIAKGRLTIQ
jgi:hypothetical protein